MHTIWNGRIVSCSWLRYQNRRKLKELMEGITPTKKSVPLKLLRLEV